MRVEAGATEDLGWDLEHVRMLKCSGKLGTFSDKQIGISTYSIRQFPVAMLCYSYNVPYLLVHSNVIPRIESPTKAADDRLLSRSSPLLSTCVPSLLDQHLLRLLPIRSLLHTLNIQIPDPSFNHLLIILSLLWEPNEHCTVS